MTSRKPSLTVYMSLRRRRSTTMRISVGDFSVWISLSRLVELLMNPRSDMSTDVLAVPFLPSSLMSRAAVRV